MAGKWSEGLKGFGTKVGTGFDGFIGRVNDASNALDTASNNIGNAVNNVTEKINLPAFKVGLDSNTIIGLGVLGIVLYLLFGKRRKKGNN